MNTAHRRLEIISTIAAKHHVTMKELAREFMVSTRTIGRDICYLSYDYPIYTREGYNGGIFIMGGYHPYVNTLSPEKLKILCLLYEEMDGKAKELLYRIIRRYGSDKLEL